jgi:hypothetical protein
MTELPTRKRPEGCISDLRFDHWLAGELDAREASELAGHVSGCVRCTARKGELELERGQFLAAAPALRADASKPAGRAKRAWLAPAAGGLALAAAVLLAVMPRGGEEPGTRRKGSDRIGFFVKRGEQVTRGEVGEHVRPGDSLRFTYTSARAQHLAILSLDSAQHASVYFPDAPRALALPAGSDSALPASVELDDSLGTERIIGLFCDSAIELEPVRARLARERTSFSAPSGCSKHELVIVKEPRTP